MCMKFHWYYVLILILLAIAFVFTRIYLERNSEKQNLLSVVESFLKSCDGTRCDENYLLKEFIDIFSIKLLSKFPNIFSNVKDVSIESIEEYLKSTETGTTATLMVNVNYYNKEPVQMKVKLQKDQEGKWLIYGISSAI